MSRLPPLSENAPLDDDNVEIHPFPVDAWLAASLLQKGIRRGDANVALRAALTLHGWRGSATWRRLAVTGCEDVGVASIPAVVATINAAFDPDLVAQRRDLGWLLTAVRNLAAAPKDRSGDLLASVIHHHPSLDDVRGEIGAMPVSRRIELAADPLADFYHRAVASWFASGIEWGYERRVGKGDLPALLAAFADLGSPSAWLQVVQLAARRTREPLTVMLPLLWLELSRTAGEVVRCSVPATREVGCLPLYCLDKHTRAGKAALHQFARENAEVRRVLQMHVPKRNASSVVCWAAFHADGSSLTERLTWLRGTEIERLGIEADLLQAGIPPGGIEAIRDVIEANLDHLNDIRERLLIAYVGGDQ